MGGSIGNKKPIGTRQNQATREILYSQRRQSSVSGRTGCGIGENLVVWAGVAPASVLRQAPFYRILTWGAPVHLSAAFPLKPNRFIEISSQFTATQKFVLAARYWRIWVAVHILTRLNVFRHNPRQEPCAVIPLARDLCGGGVGQPAFLPRPVEQCQPFDMPAVRATQGERSPT